MIVQNLRHAGWLALLAAASVVACSKTSAPEDAFLSAFLSSGNGSTCPFGNTMVIMAGAMSGGGTSLPMTVPQGDMDLNISCSVTANGDGFNLQLDAKFPGSQGGEFQATGHVTEGSADGTGGGTVTAQFVSQMAGVGYTGMGCEVTYKYLGSPIDPSQRVSPGSFFGHISCPQAAANGGAISGQTVPTADGGLAVATCDGEADVLFSNCSE